MKIRARMKQNEEGSVLVIILMVMGLVTMMGLASLNTTVVDSKVAQNSREFGEHFYNAEAAMNLAVENIVSLPAAPGNALPLTTNIDRVLNPGFNDTIAWYSWWSELTLPDGVTPMALIEVRRISANGTSTVPVAEINAADEITLRQLTNNANTFPFGTYRTMSSKDYNIIKLVVTATAVDPITKTLTNSSVQGGTSVYVMASTQ